MRPTSYWHIWRWGKPLRRLCPSYGSSSMAHMEGGAGGLDTSPLADPQAPAAAHQVREHCQDYGGHAVFLNTR